MALKAMKIDEGSGETWIRRAVGTSGFVGVHKAIGILPTFTATASPAERMSGRRPAGFARMADRAARGLFLQNACTHAIDDVRSYIIR